MPSNTGPNWAPLVALESLDLSETDIRALSKDDFSNFKNIHSLRLFNCSKLEFIHFRALELPKLKVRMQTEHRQQTRYLLQVK